MQLQETFFENSADHFFRTEFWRLQLKLSHTCVCTLTTLNVFPTGFIKARNAKSAVQAYERLKEEGWNFL